MKKFKHLSSEERSLIGHYRIRRFSLRQIAHLLDRNLPKGCSMEKLTKKECNVIANKLNDRPRKRYDYQTPQEMLELLTSVAFHS